MALKIANGFLMSTNPRDGQTVGKFECTPASTIPAVLEHARSAFREWSRKSLQQRLVFGKKAYREFYREKDAFARLVSEETGKPVSEAYSSEILPVLDTFKYYLRSLPGILRTQRIRAVNPLLKLRRGVVIYEPFGVVAVISPWNFPLLLSMQHVIPALLVGNVVIHKPSEYTTLTGLKILEIFERAQLPSRVFQVVTGLADVGKKLVEQPLDKIFFTGSTAVGKAIYEQAAKNLVPVNMELGGSDPMIVLEDANLDRAVNGALWGAFSNAGQACLSVERLYVHERLFDVFLETMIAKAKKLNHSQNGQTDRDVSCLANRAQFEKVGNLISSAVREGAVVRLGGTSREDSESLVVEPTILSDVSSQMNIAREEMFGPLVTVFPFRSDEELVALANNSQFGLAASVWTEDRKRGLRLANQLQAGSVMLNDVQIHIAQPEAPYSGYKNSGIGISHGPWGIMEMVRPKYVSSDRPGVNLLLKAMTKHLACNNIWWFKYNNRVEQGFRAFADLLHADTFTQRVKAIPGAIRGLFRDGYL